MGDDGTRAQTTLVADRTTAGGTRRARTDLARRYRDERRRAERAELLCRIVGELNAGLDLDQQLAVLQRHLLALTGLDGCWIALLDEETGTITLRTSSGQAEVLSAQQARAGHARPATMFETLIATGRPILTDDYLAECARRGFRPLGPAADRPGRAWLGVPLRVGERTIGALAAWRWDAAIDAETVGAVQLLAEQSATPIDNARLYAATERRHREEAAFNAIAQDLADSLDADILLDRIARHARALLAADVGHINLYDPDRDRLRLRAYSDDDHYTIAAELAPGEGLAGQVWASGRPMSSADYFADRRFAPPDAILRQRDDPPWVSAIAVPIALGEERLGTLSVGSRARREFTARDEAILVRLATQAALAVRNARLFAAERARAARAEALREIGRDLSAHLDLGQLLAAIRRYLARLTSAADFWVAMLDEPGGCLRLHLSVEEGEPRDGEQTFPLPLAPSLIRIVLESGQTLVADDYLAECARRGIAPNGAGGDRPGRAWLGLPLVTGGAVVGVLGLWQWQARFSPEVIETLELFAGQVATALDNARLYAAAERQRREEAAFSALAHDLAASLDADALLRRIADQTRTLLDATSSRIVLYDPARDRLAVVAGSGDNIERFIGYTLDPAVGLTGAVWQRRQPLASSHYTADDRFPHLPLFDEWSREFGDHATLGVPILLGDQPLGVLLAITPAPRHFTARDESVLARLANQTALAVHNARLFAAAQERAARLEVLNDIARDLSAEIDFERFLLSIWHHVHRITPVDGCWVALWEEASEVLNYCLYVEDGERRPEWETPLARASGTGLAWAILGEQAPLRVADYNAECRRRGLTPNGSDAQRPGIPWLGIPLRVNGRIVGAMALWRRDDRFADEETATLITLANQIAATLENARLYREAHALAISDPLTGLLNHRHLQERLEQELARAARRDEPLAVIMLDLDNFKLFNDTYGHPVGDQVLRAAAAILRAEARASDLIARYGGDEFCLVLPGADRAGALALVERIQARCRDLGAEVAPAQAAGAADGRIPLRVSAGIAAYPHDGRDRHELITRADVALYANKRGGRTLGAVGPAASAAEDDALAASAGFGVIEGLVLAVDAKDDYTIAHSQVVADAAVLLARALGLPARDVATLRTAGLLHDVGKISIPDRILRKPGALTREEWDVMRQHVEFSDLIVRGVPDLHHILEPVMHHHERWDGRGYPRGLAGEAVPLLGRIMVVADAYSAMVLDRPYRRGLSVAEAVAQLRAGAGSQFDPALVAALADAVGVPALQGLVDAVTGL